MEAMTDTRFMAWWEHYPRKTAKKSAERAWMKLQPSAELVETMTTAIDAQVQARSDAPGKWFPDWPYPASWLNGGRWTDEIAAHTLVTEGALRKAKSHRFRVSRSACPHKTVCASDEDCLERIARTMGWA